MPPAPGTETTGRIPPPGNASHSRGLSVAGSSATLPMTLLSPVPEALSLLVRAVLPRIWQALSDFAGDMAGQLDLAEAVDRMVSVLASATGAARAEAWIRVGTELRPAAIWPPGSPPSTAITIGAEDGLPPFAGASRAVAVSHEGELLGALSLHKPPNEPLTSTEDER